MAYKVFTNGSVLNASEINENLMQQSIAVFSNAAARTAAITSPVEGQLTYLEDTNAYQSYDGAAWVAFGASKILQVVSTTKTDTFSTTATAAFTDITGLSATITPSSATSKIYIIANVQVSATGADNTTVYTRLSGGNSTAYVGNAAGNRVRTANATNVRSNFNAGLSMSQSSLSYLDSPATTSAITYKVQMVMNQQTGYVNRTDTDTDNTQYGRGASTITLIEVAG